MSEASSQAARALCENAQPLVAILDTRFREAAARLERCDERLRRRCDPAGVHALRVAARRARAVLWSMKPWIRRSRYRAADAGLRAVARQVAPLRDLDVLVDTVLPGIAAKAGLTTARWRQVHTDLLRRRGRMRKDVRRAVHSSSYRRILREIRGMLTSGPALLRRSAPPGSDVWRKRVMRGLARFDRRAGRARREDLHELRILAKRCRYSLESAGEPEGGRALHRLREIQRGLGQYCDDRLAVAWLQSPDSVRDDALRARLLQVARRQEQRSARLALNALHAHP